MTIKQAQDFHLTKEEYLQGKVDWLVKDPEAWNWLCGWWASPEFRAVSDRNRRNRKSRPGLHRYSADGHVRKTQRMVWYSYSHSAGIAHKLVYNIGFYIAEG